MKKPKKSIHPDDTVLVLFFFSKIPISASIADDRTNVNGRSLTPYNDKKEITNRFVKPKKCYLFFVGLTKPLHGNDEIKSV